MEIEKFDSVLVRLSKLYQNMIEKKFGSETLSFVNNKILSKNIVRTRPTL